MATLYGSVFFEPSGRLFFGVWSGGRSTTYGTYDPVWWLSIGLGLIAAIVHWPIREEHSTRVGDVSRQAVRAPGHRLALQLGGAIVALWLLGDGDPGSRCSIGSGRLRKHARGVRARHRRG